MRRDGRLSAATGSVPCGHRALAYRERAEFLTGAAEYIAHGLARNERILYVRDEGRDGLIDELAEMGFADAVRSGQIRAQTVREHYPFVAGSDVVDPEAAVAGGVAAMERLLAKGYSGCRAVVDGAVLARTPEQRAAFSRLEYLIDQKMAALPMGALCAYNLDLLGDTAKELICLHPWIGQGPVRFRIYAEQGHDFALAGEIDAADYRAFTTALRRIWPLTTGDELVVDAHGLDFVTHRELFVIDQLSGADGRPVVLRTDHRVLGRLIELLELKNIRVDNSPDVVAGAS